MKKILSVVLAVCLVLSLSVTAFASSPSVPKSPTINPGAGAPSASGGSLNSAYTHSAKTASGAPLTASVDAVSSGAVYDEVKSAGVIAMYYINITSAVSADEIVNIDVYAPGATADSIVIVRDEWEVLPDVTLTVNGNRAIISAPAGVLNSYHYVAIVSSWDSATVNTPAEGGSNETEGEEVDAPADETETAAPAPAEDNNPTTGIALAVVPMLVAAAAAVVSKKR